MTQNVGTKSAFTPKKKIKDKKKSPFLTKQKAEVTRRLLPSLNL